MLLLLCFLVCGQLHNSPVFFLYVGFFHLSSSIFPPSGSYASNEYGFFEICKRIEGNKRHASLTCTAVQNQLPLSPLEVFKITITLLPILASSSPLRVLPEKGNQMCYGCLCSCDAFLVFFSSTDSSLDFDYAASLLENSLFFCKKKLIL